MSRDTHRRGHCPRRACLDGVALTVLYGQRVQVESPEASEGPGGDRIEPTARKNDRARRGCDRHGGHLTVQSGDTVPSSSARVRVFHEELHSTRCSFRGGEEPSQAHQQVQAALARRSSAPTVRHDSTVSTVGPPTANTAARKRSGCSGQTALHLPEPCSASARFGPFELRPGVRCSRRQGGVGLTEPAAPRRVRVRRDRRFRMKRRRRARGGPRRPRKRPLTGGSVRRR
jgi:hypothetical protein